MVRLIIFLLILASAFGFFTWSMFGLIKSISIGQKENRSDRIAARLKNVLVVAFGQSKLLREPLAGLMHFFIFWGFVILLTAVLEAIIQGITPGFSLEVLGPLYSPLAALQDTIALLVILSCIVALARWYLVPPRRYFGPEISKHVRLDATSILCLIITIMVSMIGTNGTRIIADAHPSPAHFASTWFAGLFHGRADAGGWFEFFWWTHVLVVLGFLNYLPYSKHLHVLTSIPNVFFASLRPRGELAKLDLGNEAAEKFGADDVRDLTWKQLLDGYTCTDCGRCTAACPANATGKPLSPRKIIMNIRERTSELAPLVLAGSLEQNPQVREHRLLDTYVTEDELWACTTCRACMQECPVMIEHVPTIVSMRRFLVLTESRFPSELTTTFKNLENNGAPWAFSQDARADWAQGLNVKTMAGSDGQIDLLYWVGCAGAFDQRYIKVSRAMVKLLNSASVRFAILGTEEKCNGDHARRSGNEYLAQMLIAENVETMNRYGVRKILTTCPHCFNILKNEYPQFGGRYEVIHHTTFLEQLVQSGKLKVRPEARDRITFHDSCYIGRYNGIYEAPRNLLKFSGAGLAEMPRSRDRGFCCGAGGARMFMEEKIGKRVNIERTEEALRLNPSTIATACPFCMTMMTDGVKSKDADDKVKVRDVAEVLADFLV